MLERLVNMPIFPTAGNAMCTKIAIELQLRRTATASVPIVRVRDAITKDLVREYPEIPVAAETSGMDIKAIMDEMAKKLEVRPLCPNT